MRKAKWNLTLPMAEARKNDEVVSLADSQVLRWLDEINGITDSDARARDIKAEIRSLRKEPSGIQTKRRIRQLYSKLDEVQFKPDYLCLVVDSVKDYRRACRGFSVNGIKYERLLATNGGVKNKTIVFISQRTASEIRKRIDNGRDLSKELVPAKLEAYKALTCSASTPVSLPNGILVVSDCETEFTANVICINDEGSDEPVIESRNGEIVSLKESDGYGLMSPALAARWSEELGLDYLASGVNTRFSWEKGMAFTFDFVKFADEVAGSYIINDAWGDSVDIRDVELILTTSMLKLWDSYESCDDFLQNCKDNHYTFGIAKVCPKSLESERALNYQFIQSYDLSDDDIHQLVSPTVHEIRDILQADTDRTIMYLNGTDVSLRNFSRMRDDYTKALMVEPSLINDPYVQGNIYKLIRNRINEAKVGVLNVHGNYSIVCGDPYSLCQHIFGIPVTGILKSGEIYNEYWGRTKAERLACFRAPMTCHNNIRPVRPHRSAEASYWYKYLTTCTLLNSWDTAAHALNGCDKDGDLVMLTDNPVLVGHLEELPALMCSQRKADQKVVSEEDSIRANIESFGDDIGRTTNWITSMFEVRAGFQKDSKEYKELSYRIQSGQLLQQNKWATA